MSLNILIISNHFCSICGFLCKNTPTLISHIKKTHNDVDFKKYIKDFITIPLCKCGCGEKVNINIRGNYYDFIKGHNSKNENNPMYNRKGENNPNTGKKRTQEQKQNYSIATIKSWEEKHDERYEKVFTKDYNNNMSEIVQKRWDNDNGTLRDIISQSSKELWKDNEYREKSTKSRIEVNARPGMRKRKSEKTKQTYKDNPQLREKAQERAIKNIQNGILGVGTFKTEWKHNPFTQKEEFMGSSYETKFLDKCIEFDVPVTKKHDIKINYFDIDGIEHIYLPDFISLDGMRVYEIKGYKNTDITVKLKKQSALKWCEANNKKYIFLDKPRFVKNDISKEDLI